MDTCVPEYCRLYLSVNSSASSYHGRADHLLSFPLQHGALGSCWRQSVIHLFNPQTFIESLLCAGNCSRQLTVRQREETEVCHQEVKSKERRQKHKQKTAVPCDLHQLKVPSVNTGCVKKEATIYLAYGSQAAPVLALGRRLDFHQTDRGMVS